MIENKLSIEESNTIWRLKAIAVFTIFFAHLPYRGESVVMLYLFNYLGILGVPIFLMLSGYFESFSTSSTISKMKSLFIPLIIWGTFGYIPSIIFENLSLREGVIGYVKFLYGCGTWLYFVPVLFWCRTICTFKIHNTYIYIILASLSCLSIILTSLGLINYNEYFTRYTNPFNFLVYYILGIIISKFNFSFKAGYLVLISTIVIVSIILLWNNLPSYFSIFCIPFSISSFILLYNVARIMRKGENIGKMSYVIYLSHMIPMGIISSKIPFMWGTPWQVINVLLIFIIIVVGLWSLGFVLNKIKHSSYFVI